MAMFSVTDFSFIINHQIKQQEQVEFCLERLEALMAVVTMTDNIYDLSRRILHTYFSVVSDLIDDAAKANQISLNELLKL